MSIGSCDTPHLEWKDKKGWSVLRKEKKKKNLLGSQQMLSTPNQSLSLYALFSLHWNLPIPKTPCSSYTAPHLLCSIATNEEQDESLFRPSWNGFQFLTSIGVQLSGSFKQVSHQAHPTARPVLHMVPSNPEKKVFLRQIPQVLGKTTTSPLRNVLHLAAKCPLSKGTEVHMCFHSYSYQRSWI